MKAFEVQMAAAVATSRKHDARMMAWTVDITRNGLTAVEKHQVADMMYNWRRLTIFFLSSKVRVD